jgi:hypothetical protein
LLSDNNTILKANCNAHIINNCCKKGSDILDIDIGNVWPFFIIHQKEKGQAISFLFVECEYSELLRYVPARWLSVGKAVECLLQNFEAI